MCRASKQGACWALSAVLGVGCGGSATLPVGADKASEALDNLPVLASAGADREVLAGYQTYLDGSGSYDPLGQSFTYSWHQLFGPPVFLSNPTAPRPSFIAPLEETDLGFTLSTDNGSFTTTDTVVLRVRHEPSLLAPLVRAGADRYLDYGAALKPLASDLQAVSPTSATVTWEQVEAKPAATAATDAALVPAPVSIFRVSAEDNGLSSAPDYLLLWTYAPEQKKAFAPDCVARAPLKIEPNSTFTLDAKGSSDVNDDPLTYRWQQIEGEPLLAVGQGGISVELTAPPMPQELIFQLHARDRLLSCAPAEVKVLVSSTSDMLPVAVAPPATLRTHTGNTVWLDALAEANPTLLQSPTTELSTFTWVQTLGTEVALQQDGTSPQATFIAPPVSPGSSELAFEVVATRNGVESAPAVTQVEVLDQGDNQAPEVTLCTSTASPAITDVVTLSAQVKDSENDPLSLIEWTATSLATVSLEPAPAAPGDTCGQVESTPPEFALPATSSQLYVTLTMPTEAVQVQLKICDSLGACGTAQIDLTPQ